jgi:outer membrane receptor protein involved in Fe transport
MKPLLTSSLLLILFSFISNPLAAQTESVTVSGFVVDSQDEQAIDFATVVLMNSVTRQVMTGTTTLADGSFSLEAETDQFVVQISFIGYLTQTITDITVKNGKVALGTILLSEDSQTLDEIVVRAEKSQTEFKLDRRVFNVGQDLSSTGASALELLNNVPSVNVSIEGQISLRGSNGVQILINGKPSVLASEEGNTLGTITADMIDRIEVITNPSAKYEAEGTSGIINIILKKEERKGINGSVTLNTGLPQNHSLGLSLNRRTDKFNLFSQMGVGYREMPSNNENINRDFKTGNTILSNGTDYRNEAFYNFILGTDYYINPLNIITLSGSFTYEMEDQPSLTNFRLLDANDAPVTEWYRTEVTSAANPKWQYELQYKKDFKDNEDHVLLFSALGRFFGKDQTSEFDNVSTFGTLDNTQQQTETSFGEASYTFQLDYTKPFSEKVKLEVGSQYVITDVSNDFAVTDFIDGEWLPNLGLTNVFEYDQKVFGVYSTGSYEGDKWGVKVGLRLENTDLTTLLATTNESNNQQFTNLFPSFHTSYKVTERMSLQAGYSKRIYRPRLWDLNPFFNIRNNFNIRAGNPNLLPEFTDSYELNTIYILDKVSLNLGFYHRYTTDVIERVSTFEDNVNIFRPQNIGTNQATGIEFNAKYTANKWLVINTDVNYNYFNRQGVFGETSFDFDADQWSSKLMAKFKLPADFDFEVTGNYQSSVQTVQSVVSQNIFADLGVRKKIVGGKAVINLSVRDIFASRFRESVINQDDFYVYSFGQRGRFVTLGFSYGFGKGEAMTYGGGGRRH